MDFPIKFPSDAEVVIEETARFRALSPEDRMRSIRSLLAAGALMMPVVEKLSHDDMIALAAYVSSLQP